MRACPVLLSCFEKPLLRVTQAAWFRLDFATGMGEACLLINRKPLNGLLKLLKREIVTQWFTRAGCLLAS